MQKRNPTAMAGTLVVIVPSQEGLVVAADSRSTIAGNYYDIKNKIIVPGRPGHTVASVTGTSEFLTAPIPPDTQNVEAYLQGAPRLMDIYIAVKGYLENADDAVGQTDMAALGEACIAEARQCLTAGGSGIVQMANMAGGSLCNVVVASHDPETVTSTVQSLRVLVSSSIDLSVSIRDPIQFRADDPADPLMYGETDYFNNVVCGSDGRRFVSQGIIDFLRWQPTVKDVTVSTALSQARDTIDACEKTSAIVPPPSGIGGPVTCYLLGENPAPRRL